MNFTSTDLDVCRINNHRFQMVGSDKTPMKRSLVCLTCSEKTGSNAYAAYGVESLSWGQWRNPARVKEPEVIDDSKNSLASDY